MYISYICILTYTRTCYGLLSYALVHKLYRIVRKLHFGILVEQETTSTVTPAANIPQPINNALIGVAVALAVLMASVVGACVPVIVCVYVRNRHSKKQIVER